MPYLCLLNNCLYVRNLVCWFPIVLCDVCHLHHVVISFCLYILLVVVYLSHVYTTVLLAMSVLCLCELFTKYYCISITSSISNCIVWCLPSASRGYWFSRISFRLCRDLFLIHSYTTILLTMNVCVLMMHLQKVFYIKIVIGLRFY